MAATAAARLAPLDFSRTTRQPAGARQRPASNLTAKFTFITRHGGELKSRAKHMKKSQRITYMLQHGVGPGGQPLQEVAGSRRHPALEPRVAERVQPGDERHDPERRDLQSHGGNEAKLREQRRRPRVLPREQRRHPLPLRRHVPDHRLDPPGHAPQCAFHRGLHKSTTVRMRTPTSSTQ